MYTAVNAGSMRIKALSSMGQHLAVPHAAGNAIKRRGPERLAAACSAEFVSTPSGQSLTLGPFRRFQGGEQSFADARVNGKVAPIPAVRVPTIGRLKSTQKRTAASIKFCMRVLSSATLARASSR
jgi:hypothetical protein